VAGDRRRPDHRLTARHNGAWHPVQPSPHQRDVLEAGPREGRGDSGVEASRRYDPSCEHGTRALRLSTPACSSTRVSRSRPARNTWATRTRASR
jgi:hypothetical protein